MITALEGQISLYDVASFSKIPELVFNTAVLNDVMSLLNLGLMASLIEFRVKIVRIIAGWFEASPARVVKHRELSG